jgi:hypothetical protein
MIHHHAGDENRNPCKEKIQDRFPVGLQSSRRFRILAEQRSGIGGRTQCTREYDRDRLIKRLKGQDPDRARSPSSTTRPTRRWKSIMFATSLKLFGTVDRRRVTRAARAGNSMSTCSHQVEAERRHERTQSQGRVTKATLDTAGTKDERRTRNITA